jgi:hypothetical protein
MQMHDLFDLLSIDRPQEAWRLHEAGGKVKIAIASDILGDAGFSICGKRRLWLSRRWGTCTLGTTLFVGMNPSTAAAEIDDPTVHREIGFTRRWGHDVYLKANVMDWRATEPKHLLGDDMEPCGPDNLTTIRELASRADTIVMAFGALHPRIAVHGRNTVEALRKDGRVLMCLGLTKDGHPRHPLYLRKDSELRIFAG